MSYLPSVRKESPRPAWRKEKRLCPICQQRWMFAADAKCKQDWERQKSCKEGDCYREMMRRAAVKGAGKRKAIGRASW